MRPSPRKINSDADRVIIWTSLVTIGRTAWKGVLARPVWAQSLQLTRVEASAGLGGALALSLTAGRD